MNGYAYVNGNPTNLTDPSGMIAETPSMGDSCWQQEDKPCTLYPGWTGRTYGSIYGDFHRCTNDRTLKSGGGLGIPLSDLQQWWNGLSNTEREIEEALAATNTDQCRSNAPFNHIPDHTFDFVSGWILSNASDIQDVSDKLNVDPALVAGILASEMLFDYGRIDVWSDIIGTPELIDPGQGYGYASAHKDAREAATNYIQQFIDSGTVDPVFPVQYADRQWLRMDYGAIVATATVARWLVDPYINQINVGYTTARVLSAEEMGVIFTAYRAGVGGWSPSDTYAFVNMEEYRKYPSLGLPCNAQLTLPVMRYAKTIFS